MFLKQIEVENFKCHEHLVLDFATGNKQVPIRKTTFMLGENGTGKSALLKAIALVTAGSNALPGLLGEPESWIKNGKKSCLIKACIVTADGLERNIRLSFQRGHSLREIINENRESLEQIDEAIKKADRNYFILAYGASRRYSYTENFSISRKDKVSQREKNVSSLFNPDASLTSLTEWAMDLDYSSNGKALATVKGALNKFLIADVKFKSIDKKKKRLLFKTPDGDVPLDQLSDGYQNVAAWVGDLMFNITSTFRDRSTPLESRGLLLIDEIDLHLHPKWQRQLHTFLKEKLPRFQVIATTHSPLTAQQAQAGELYALKRDGKKIELVPFIGDPSRMLIHQILMSPVFGLLTDESVKVEDAKKTVRAISLSNKSEKTKNAEKKPFTELLKSVPVNVRSNNLLDRNDINLLTRINSELKAKKK